MRRSVRILLILSLTVSASAQAVDWKKPLKKVDWKKPIDKVRELQEKRRKRSTTLPITTSSMKARKLFEAGRADFENLKTDKALENWRKATKLDPKFALAHIEIALVSKDPAEQNRELKQAKALTRQVTAGERLFIRWVAGVRENNYVAGIQAMNDVVAKYPRDKHLIYIVGNWLILQESYDQCRKMMERALAVDPGFPPALNNLGYAYASTREYKKAFDVMETYVAVLPNEPNPNDSYGEILRMSGDFAGALQHYNAALKIDPQFAQLGVADTYALMGDGERARAEYAKGIDQATSASDRVELGMQSAMTWVREKKYGKADSAFLAVAAEAHGAQLGLHEAQIHRMMAIYQPDDAVALNHLKTAEEILVSNPNLLKSDLDEERARVLRWRAVRASRAGDNETANKALEELQALESSSGSRQISHAYHAAVGAVLMMQESYFAAIPHLEEDHENAFSMKLLAEAYARTGAMAEANEQYKKLTTMNLPTIDQAVVVPAARERLAANPPAAADSH